MKYLTEKYGEIRVLTQCATTSSTESLEFLTEVHQNYDGSEDRYPLRDDYRQRLSFNFANSYKDMGDFFNQLNMSLRKNWGVPLFHLRQSITNLQNTDFLIADTKTYPIDLHIGYAVILSGGIFKPVQIIEIGREIITQEEIRDPDTNEVIQPEIREYQDGYKFSEHLTVSNALIMPMRICIIEGDVSISAGGFWGYQDVNFLVMPEDVAGYPEDAPTQYKGNDIYFIPLVSESDALETTLTQHQNIIDGQIGGFKQYTHWDKPKYIKPFIGHLKTFEQLKNYRKFLYRRMGRLKPFWMPLYEKHLTILNSGNITNTITVNTETNRNYIAFLVGGVWSAHEITSRTANVLLFTPALNKPKSAIQSVCYLALHRLNSDNIDISFDGRLVKASTSIVEIEN